MKILVECEVRREGTVSEGVAYPGSLVVGTLAVVSIGLLEKREDNFEKKEDLAAGLMEEVSWVVRAVYAFDAWFCRGRFCPL